MCETLKILISVISPFVGVAGGYWLSMRAERRKALQPIAAHVIELRDDAERASDMLAFHRESISRLRDPIYQALSILGRKRSKKLHEVWMVYRHMPISGMHDDEFLAGIRNVLGKPTATKEGAIIAMLSYIEAEINNA